MPTPEGQTATTESVRRACGGPSRGALALVAAAALAASVAFVWWPTLDAGFVFDDRVHILEREATIARLWPPTAWALGTQRPITQLSLALNHAIGGTDPTGYHALNIALHASVAILLFAAIRRAGSHLRRRGRVRMGDDGILLVAWLSALVWALHPLCTAAATYVIQRAEILSVLWTLAAAIVLFRTTPAERVGRRGGAAAALLTGGFVLLALLSKPTAVFAPPLLLLLDRWIVAEGWRDVLRRRWPLHAAAWAALASLLLTGVLRGLVATGGPAAGAGLSVAEFSPLSYAGWQVRSLGLYLSSVFAPGLMSIDHGTEQLVPLARAIVGWAGLAVVAAAALVGVRRGAWWCVLPLGFAITLAPTTSVIPLADPAADHRMYLPLVFPVVAAVCAGASLLAVARRIAPLAAAVGAALAVVAIVALETVATTRRNAAYRDPALLWTEVVERRPTHARGHVHRAIHRLESGDESGAEEDLRAAERLEPGSPSLLVNLAIMDLRRGDAEEALRRLDIARLRRSADPTLLAARGDALRALGRVEEAAAEYALASARAPSRAEFELARGNALAELGRADEAIAAFGSAARSAADPGIRAAAWFNLGNMRYRQDRFVEAASAYRLALEADPSHGGARRWLMEAESRAAE